MGSSTSKPEARARAARAAGYKIPSAATYWQRTHPDAMTQVVVYQACYCWEIYDWAEYESKVRALLRPAPGDVLAAQLGPATRASMVAGRRHVRRHGARAHPCPVSNPPLSADMKRAARVMRRTLGGVF